MKWIFDSAGVRFWKGEVVLYRLISSAKSRVSLIPVLLAVLMLISSVQGEEKGETILRKTAEKLESIDQLCADYVQTFNWKLAQETHTISGSICIRNGVQFRIETPDQLIITDGTTLWTVSHNNEQVIIDVSENNTSDNPFLKSFLRNIMESYNVQLIDEQNNQWQLLLTALSQDEFQREIQLWIDKKSRLMTRIVQVDINENTAIYELTRIDTDTELKDEVFQARIPQGYEVIDMR